MVWAVFQYGVEGWTLKKSDRNRIEAFEMWCWRKMLSISWQEHRTNDSILTEFSLERELMRRVAKLILQYFGHITRGSAGQLALTEKTVDTWHWRVDWLRIHSAKDVTRSSTMEKKDIRVAIAVANPHRGRSTSEWLSQRRNTCAHLLGSV